MTQIPDDTLLVLYANGDAQAAVDLTRRMTPMVMALAFRMLGDRAEAEDVVQDAMLRLWKMAPEWVPGQAKVTTWLYTVAGNLCRDRLRKRRGVGLDEIAEPEDDRPSADQRLTTAERADALQAALASLPDRQREAVILRHIEGLPNPEIAQIMDITVEAVESLTARGKRSLAARLLAQKEALGL